MTLMMLWVPVICLFRDVWHGTRCVNNIQEGWEEGSQAVVSTPESLGLGTGLDSDFTLMIPRKAISTHRLPSVQLGLTQIQQRL